MRHCSIQCAAVRPALPILIFVTKQVGPERNKANFLFAFILISKEILKATWINHASQLSAATRFRQEAHLDACMVARIGINYN